MRRILFRNPTLRPRRFHPARWPVRPHLRPKDGWRLCTEADVCPDCWPSTRTSSTEFNAVEVWVGGAFRQRMGRLGRHQNPACRCAGVCRWGARRDRPQLQRPAGRDHCRPQGPRGHWRLCWPLREAEAIWPDYRGLCPFHTERTPSFQVSPRWQNYRCWGCGVAGDVIDFVGALENLSTGEAVGRFRELVGGAALDPAAIAAQTARRAAAAAQEAQEAARDTARAQAIWSQAEYLTRRSDPLPVAYLTERRGIARWDTYSLRWHPHCPWELGTAGCIVAPIENLAGDLVAIWRIRPVMDGKVERRGLGPMKGCPAPVIDHAGLDVLTIAEGVEDALAAWVLTTYPAWAALSAGNMAALQLPSSSGRSSSAPTPSPLVSMPPESSPGGYGPRAAKPESSCPKWAKTQTMCFWRGPRDDLRRPYQRFQGR